MDVCGPLDLDGLCFGYRTGPLFVWALSGWALPYTDSPFLPLPLFPHSLSAAVLLKKKFYTRRDFIWPMEIYFFLWVVHQQE